jgi:hypothetical protein
VASACRIQTLTASARNSTGTATGNVTLILRAAVAGATSTASPLQWRSTVNLPGQRGLGPVSRRAHSGRLRD